MPAVPRRDPSHRVRRLAPVCLPAREPLLRAKRSSGRLPLLRASDRRCGFRRAAPLCRFARSTAKQKRCRGALHACGRSFCKRHRSHRRCAVRRRDEQSGHPGLRAGRARAPASPSSQLRSSSSSTRRRKWRRSSRVVRRAETSSPMTPQAAPNSAAAPTAKACGLYRTCGLIDAARKPNAVAKDMDRRTAARRSTESERRAARLLGSVPMADNPRIFRRRSRGAV